MRLATRIFAPDILVIDNTRLLHVLVSTGISFQKSASQYFDKPITLIPAIQWCILPCTDALNQYPFHTLSPIEDLARRLSCGASDIAFEKLHRRYKVPRGRTLLPPARRIG